MKKEILFNFGIKNSPLSIDIRKTVFMEEQGFCDEFDETDNCAWHILMVIDGRAVATARFFQSEKGWQVGRVAVLKEFRKQGIGEEVMIAAEKKVRELGGKEISLSAQVRAKGFYEKIGYRCCGDVYYDEHCPHIFMKKEI